MRTVTISHPVLTTLRQMIREAGSQKQVAQFLKITPGYLNDILQGYRQPGPKVLAALGFERTTVYRKRRGA